MAVGDAIVLAASTRPLREVDVLGFAAVVGGVPLRIPASWPADLVPERERGSFRASGDDVARRNDAAYRSAHAAAVRAVARTRPRCAILEIGFSETASVDGPSTPPRVLPASPSLVFVLF